MNQPEAPTPDASGFRFEIGPAPHAKDAALTTRRMMIDVWVALTPVLAVSTWVFGRHAWEQLAICVSSCLVAETVFDRLRGRRAKLSDGSATVTGAILALSLPVTAPWYVGVIGSTVASGIGKAVFGGLGQNIFNPAMVGRAFVMIGFPASMGAAAYALGTDAGGALDALSSATPLTAFKRSELITPLGSLVVGTVNGSLGETSALACLAGGLYLCVRRAASWEIPAGMLGVVLLVGSLANLAGGQAPQWTVWHRLCSGSLLFGACFIATDPVTSPLTPRGKWIFGAGIGALVLLIRRLSGYPEGVMFAVLTMNAVTPLIDRWTIPTPVGGPTVGAEQGQ